MTKTIFITGGTGFIGQKLVTELLDKGYSLIVLTRDKNQPNLVRNESLRFIENVNEIRSDEQIATVINLAGVPIADKKWDAKRKKAILDSRVGITQKTVELIKRLKSKPEIFISASAVGYYGFCGDEILTEKDAPKKDFLSSVCQRWEEEAKKAENEVGRICLLRIGVVLGKGGGALSRMVLPYRFFLGGPVGSGNQWLPWIHQADLLGIIRFLLLNKRLSGAVNAVSPETTRNRDFSWELGLVLKRPALITTPGFALRFALGELSDMLLKGQRVTPQVLLNQGYEFRYPTLKEALEDIFSNQR
ncbi:MAG: TIGR01777 family oxidoreductase [Deltaproteobacteria bacterium]|nr:TIGR01777 family oxidoreductase [Deltaproteobacteria bacterium]